MALVTPEWIGQLGPTMRIMVATRRVVCPGTGPGAGTLYRYAVEEDELANAAASIANAPGA